MDSLKFDPQTTSQRLDKLETYFQTNVLNGERFVCREYQQCEGSHPGPFYAGQLHHVGKYYDTFMLGYPYRIVVVAQEYGHPPAYVSLESRREMVLNETGLQKTFNQRNPHMRGTTSALRLLHGIPLAADRAGEFLQTSTYQCHIFDAFALINYLLCSAVIKGGKRRSKATKVMLSNCQRHFRKAIEILEPNAMVVQSKGYWPWIRKAFDRVDQLTENLFKAELDNEDVLIAVFAHPSTPDNDHNWGRSADTVYLLDTVAPTLNKVRDLILEQDNSILVSRVSQPNSDSSKQVRQAEEKQKILNYYPPYEDFLGEMQNHLLAQFSQSILVRKPRFKVRGNRMQIYLDLIRGSHYEMCFRRKYHEFALHFESTPGPSLARRQAFDPHLRKLSERIGHNVRSGPHENRGWMRVWVQLPPVEPILPLLEQYQELFLRFIEATYPILEAAYIREAAEK
jgi:hypothetical protein